MARTIILFDFDGTIFDTMKNHGKLAVEVIVKYLGLSFSEAKKKYYATTGLPFPEQLKIIAPKASSELKRKCAEEYVNRKLKDVFFKSKPFPDIKPMLEGLKKKGYILGISTSTEASIIARLLAKHGLKYYFNYFSGLKEGTKLDHISRMKKTYKPKITVFVGDSPHDVGLKKSAKDVITVGRSGPKSKGMKSASELKKAGADFVFSDLTKLVRLDIERRQLRPKLKRKAKKRKLPKRIFRK